jgi:hypothetical protein
MTIYIIILAIALPIGWLIAEIKGRVVARRIFGALTIVAACLIGWGVGMLQQLNYNAWYGHASKKLLEGVAASLPTELPERKILEESAQKFRPTYENRARYDVLVDSILESLPDKEQNNK